MRPTRGRSIVDVIRCAISLVVASGCAGPLRRGVGLLVMDTGAGLLVVDAIDIEHHVPAGCLGTPGGELAIDARRPVDRSLVRFEQVAEQCGIFDGMGRPLDVQAFRRMQRVVGHLFACGVRPRKYAGNILAGLDPIAQRVGDRSAMFAEHGDRRAFGDDSLAVRRLVTTVAADLQVPVGSPGSLGDANGIVPISRNRLVTRPLSGRGRIRSLRGVLAPRQRIRRQFAPVRARSSRLTGFRAEATATSLHCIRTEARCGPSRGRWLLGRRPRGVCGGRPFDSRPRAISPSGLSQPRI
ncbi:Uncharacterised protein [Mycobacteroides abscessus subsp. bolletii]|nr:Uncharacterised protein [Mycobacteroides abscessus subsp. bolletii]